MKRKIPEVWDDCKTKEEKEAFIKELETIEKKSKFRPFDELLEYFGVKV